MRFKERSSLHNITVQGEEAASADIEAAARYPGHPAKAMNEGGDTEQQIFSVDFGRRCHSQRTKVDAWLQRTGWVSLLGANAAEDFQLKPYAHLPFSKS